MTIAEDAALRVDPLRLLTPKEQACLRLVAGHLSSKEIAVRLGISKTSVDTYCDRAREKLGVHGRREAARLLAAALAEEAPAASVHTAGEAPPRAPSARRRRRFAVLIAVLAPIALATLLAGLRALREVVPDPHEPAAAASDRPASG